MLPLNLESAVRILVAICAPCCGHELVRSGFRTVVQTLSFVVLDVVALVLMVHLVQMYQMRARCNQPMFSMCATPRKV